MNGSDFEINTKNTGKPMLVVCSNASDEITFIYRGRLSSTTPIEINERTTAVALLSLHPVFWSMNLDDYGQFSEQVSKLKGFSRLVEEVKTLIGSNRNLMSTSNESLIAAMNTCYEQLLGTDAASVEKRRTQGVKNAKAKAGETDEETDTRPIEFCPEAVTTAARVSGFAPVYECYTEHDLVRSESKLLLPHESYSWTDLYQMLLMGFKLQSLPEAWDDFVHGDWQTFDMGDAGDYYFTGPMKDTFGTFAENDCLIRTSVHTGEKYLLAYHMVVNGVDIFGMSPDPDEIFSSQGFGITDEILNFMKKRLDEVDPEGIKPILVVCHYQIATRWDGEPELYGDYADAIFPVLRKHKNLLYLYGHVHSLGFMCREDTSEMMLHFRQDGTLQPTSLHMASSREAFEDDSERSFGTILMGQFRIDYEKDLFEDDGQTGRGGFDKEMKFVTTGTPKASQGLIVRVYEDRMELEMRNFGTYPGFETDIHGAYRQADGRYTVKVLKEESKK